VGVKSHEIGYFGAVGDRPLSHGPTVSQALLSMAAGVGFVVLVLALLVLAVSAVVFVDLRPQMR